MDHSVDKDLAGWSQSCSEWFNVQVKTSGKLCSSGVSIGTAAV